jgi:hypothetical protein
MFFVPSWKALYGQLAAQQPQLKDFSGHTQLIQYGANATEFINMIINAPPHCATLVICAGHKIITIHHFKHDFITRVTLDGTDELWALLGNGATALPVQVDMSSVAPWFLFHDSHLESFE